MSSYRVEFTPEAVRQMKKLDRATQKMIFAWINKNLEGCENPRVHGKGLTADQSGKWRYRVGNYRILAVILDEKIVIQVFKVGHRSTVYQR